MRISKNLTYRIAAVFFSGLLIISCDKGGHRTYTSTNGSGNVIGDEDPTDWGYDVDWDKKTYDLIGSNCVINPYGAANNIVVYPAYPNPVQSDFTFLAITSGKCFGRFLVADENHQIYGTHCAQFDEGNNFLQFSKEDMDLLSGKFYRFYYAFSDSTGNIFYKGHGDLLMD